MNVVQIYTHIFAQIKHTFRSNFSPNIGSLPLQFTLDSCLSELTLPSQLFRGKHLPLYNLCAFLLVEQFLNIFWLDTGFS